MFGPDSLSLHIHTNEFTGCKNGCHISTVCCRGWRCESGFVQHIWEQAIVRRPGNAIHIMLPEQLTCVRFKTINLAG